LREVHSSLKSEFFKECDPELPPSNASIFLLPSCHPTAAYVSFLAFFSLYSFLQLCDLECSSYTVLCSQSSWSSFILLCEEFSFPPSLCVILLHYLRDPSKLSSPSFSSTTLQNFPATSVIVSEESKFPHHKKLCFKCSISLIVYLALSLIFWCRELSSC
jgi:hypothetical protein